MRTQAGRYFLCADLVVVIVALAVTGVVSVGLLVTVGDASPGEAVPVGLLLYLVVAVVALALLRRPGRAEPGQVAGFAAVRAVRRRLASGETLSAPEQAVADDLAGVVEQRLTRSTLAVRVAVVVLVAFGAVLALGIGGKDVNAVLGATTTIVVVLAVLLAERLRTARVRSDLLGPGSAVR